MSDEFTPDERRALDAWVVPEPDDDLASRVLDEVFPKVEAKSERSPKKKKKKKWWALAVGAAAALAIALVMDQSASGHLEATQRTTAMLGRRATAVAEAGTALEWTVASRGDASVRQNRGNVFYRVERGGAFQVHAGQTKVRVLGTSFRVEVQEMKTKNALAAGAVAGAMVATAVVVTVYEGRVDAASPAGRIELNAGEAAVLRPDEAPVRRSPKLTTVVEAEASAGSAAAPTAALAKAEAAAPIEVQRALAAARAENRQLQEALADAKHALEEAPKMAERANRTYDLDDATLKRMADQCKLAWDNISTGPEPPRVPDDAVEKLELAPDERAVIDEKFAASHADLTNVIRETYTAVTGDTNTGSLATEAMFMEIRDKTDKDTMQVIFQRLARERAGLQPPPADPSTMSPIERMFRVVTGSGDALESAIASELGPEQARRLRDLNNGWNSRSKSSHGCPK